MSCKWFGAIGAAFAALLVALNTTLALAQVPAGQKEMAEHKQRMAEQHGMLGTMSAADQKIADLVAKMDAATGEEKVAAMAAVINELVAQRRQMHESCGMMKTAPAPATDATAPDHGAHHPQK